MKNDMAGAAKGSSFLKRLRYAAQGILGAWRREPSFRFQCFCFCCLLIFCLIVRPSVVWIAIFTVCSVLVLGLELVNTALETTLDKLHPAKSEEIGFVKDCLAGAVLIVSLGSLIVFILFLVSQYFI